MKREYVQLCGGAGRAVTRYDEGGWDGYDGYDGPAPDGYDEGWDVSMSASVCTVFGFSIRRTSTFLESTHLVELKALSIADKHGTHCTLLLI